MVTMPGNVVEGAWSPDDDAEQRKKAAGYKPDMAEVKPPPAPAFSGPDDKNPATFAEVAPATLWDRFKGNLKAWQEGGTFHQYEKGDVRDALYGRDILPNGKGGVYQQTEEDAQADAQRKIDQMAEDKFYYENMDAADTPLEKAVGFAGGAVGALADPLNLINPEAKIGTTAWRYSSPVFAKMLDYGVSNAALNAIQSFWNQAEDKTIGLRDSFDWGSVLLDGGIGAAFSAPFGYLHGKAAQAEQLVEEQVRAALDALRGTPAPAPGTAPMAPRVPKPAVTPPERPPEVTTVESLSAAHDPADIQAAQETLFGEVVGTRNLTPDQLNQVDDYINAGKAYGETIDRPVQDMPPVREPAQPQAEPLPQVPEQRQPEGSANPAPAPESASPGTREPAPLAGGYQDFRPADLKVDASRFQFKGGGDEQGVVDTLKKVKKWDPNKAGVVIVWQDLAGNNFIVDGHQRYGLAKRLAGEGQDPILHAKVWREADGISAEDAKVLAADINISQGSGTAIDAAKILRARPEMLDNLPKNAVTDHGVGLAKLSDDAFGMVVNGKVPPEYGAIVGKLAPNTSTHAQIMDVLAKNEPASAAQAESMVRDVLAAPEVEQTMTDMFGSSEVTQILFKERAQVLSSAATALRKDRAAFNTLVKEEARLTGAGNKLATATNLERAQTDAEILATLQATARRKGPIADALAAAAKSLHDGTPRQVAVREFLDRIRGEVKGASPDGAGLPASPQSIAARLGGYRDTTRPGFDRWFGNSKVVDENGDPLVMYHGTSAGGFDEFDTYASNYGLMGQGAYFTDNPEVASSYTTKGAKGREEPAPTVYPVYLKIENPLDMGAAPDAKAWANAYSEYVGPEDFAGAKTNEDAYRVVEDALRDEMLPKWEGAEIMQDGLRRMGFDGITHIGGGRVKADGVQHRVYIAFEPTQIKSIYNRGTWDAQDPRISFSAPRQAGPGLFDAPPKAGALSPQMERVLTLAKGQMGASGNAYGDQLNEALRKGWVTGKEGYTKAGGNRFTRYHITPAGEAALAGKFDVGADGKPQAVLPGAERIGDKSLAERKAAAPLKASKPQKALDFGLFGSGKDQMDLLDVVNKGETLFRVRGEGDYLDFRPTGIAVNNDIGGVSVTYVPRDGEVEIISLRTPTQSRNQGLASAALDEFLRAADEDGLVVKAYLKPQDRATDEGGLQKLFQKYGFQPGEKPGEFVRSGPSLKDIATRAIDDGFAQVAGLINAAADIADIATHPFILGAVRRMEAIPLTDAQPGFMSDVWRAERSYDFPDGQVQGYDAAITRLTDEAKTFSTNGPVRKERKAVIMLGPPAAGKSTFAEKFAAARYAAIVDPDEAKKVIPEFNRGIGANAVHEESAIMAQEVMANLMAEGSNFVIPKVGHNDKGIRKLILMLQENGYTVDLVNINVTYENAFRRMMSRFLKTGRLINPEYVKSVGELPAQTYQTLRKQGIANGYAEIDANGKFGEPSKVLDDTGITDDIPGLGRDGGPSVRPADGGDAGATGSQGSDPGIAFAARPQPGSNMPVNRSQAGVPANQNRPQVGRLEDVGNLLREVTGAPVRQGRLARAPKGQKVAGQYNRGDGVIRLREATDFETQAHETAHSLETEWGRSLSAIKDVHRNELEPLAYAGADPKQQLSEGFAEWFRFFVTTPNYARRVAPNFTDAFVNMLEAGDRAQLDRIRAAQAGYMAWTQAPSAAVVSADIVSSRKGNVIAEAVAEAGGPREALGEFLSKAYTATIDKMNPINRAVDELMKVYEKRTGRALDIKSAEDPYRLARLTADSFAAGHIDAMHGVVPYRGVVSEGASLSDAITTALGAQWRGWDDTAMADFASYLVSRRALKEYDRFMAGEIPNPPGKFTRGDYEVTVQELEAAHPNYAVAADMVYEWNQNMLRKKYESGFITEDLYKELSQREDYVPMMRDLRDLDKEAGDTPANMTLRSSIMKAFRGSKRSVINPLESMLADAYQFNALMKRNEVFRALEDLAQRAGPGAGAIVERIPAKQLNPTRVNVGEALKAAAKDVGLSPQDVDQLSTFVDGLLGEDATATLFRAGQINEKGEPIIYTWRDGKQHALRLADGEFGRDLYNAMTGMNKEMRNLFITVASLPSTALRYGITTAPHFIVANYIRDQISAWVLAGDGFIPFVSGMSGMADELMQRESARIYNTVGGIMGGGNVASLDKGRAKRDINALNKAGYNVKRFASIRGFSEFTGISETGTRLGIFKNSYARAKKAGMTDYEAAVEAAYQARDYIDFGRHGSQTHAARRLVTFLNASLQGLDKTYRVLTAEGALKKAITPYINKAAGRPLTARDKANLGKSLGAWTKMTAVGMFGLGLSYLYKDDPEYEEVSDYLKATHWMVKKGPGEWYAIPKPFELGFVSNLFERTFETVYKGNPVAMQSFIDGLYEVTAPPMGIPLFETMYEIKHNRDDMGRDIVGQDIAGYEPWRQYTAQTSEIAKNIGYALNVSPAKIDHALQGWGGSWGKIITDASTARQQGKSEVDILAGSMTNRFIRDETRGATSTVKFWSLISESTGAMAQAATTYKDLFESAGQARAEEMLASKDENTKAYALMLAHFKPEVERLNPLVRAKDSISVLSKVRKELAGNDVTDTENSTDEEPLKLTLTPTQRQMAQEFIARLSMIEARNALVVEEVPGWQQKTLMETESLYQDLRSTSPELADEIEARMEKKKVYDFDEVRENWPDVKSRILEDRQDADFSDILAMMGVK